MNKLLDTLLTDIQTRLGDEFNRNFQRQAFFDKPWKPRQGNKNPKRGVLIGKGRGRLWKSLRSKIRGNSIVFTSNVPYASVHNEGFNGTQSVKAHSRIIKAHTRHITARTSLKTRKEIKAHNQQVREHTQNVGAFSRSMEIPQRQFIGDHPKVRSIIKETIDDTILEFNKQLEQQLKQR